MSSLLISRLLSLGLLLAAMTIGCIPAADSGSLDYQPENALYVGSAACAVCHEDVFENYSRTIHYRIREFEVLGEQRGCESCHGPGSLHVESKGNVENIIQFTRVSQGYASRICLKCHAGGAFRDWASNLHALSEVGCSSCHKVHKRTAPKMLYKGDPQLCYDCHQQMQVKVELPSHHPIREGKMKCTECHDPHSVDPGALRNTDTKNLCYDCHADKQGPFLFEHPPVEESCSLCHDAHGTIANNLLKQSEPFLCLRCHQGHRGTRMPGRHPTLSALLTSCTQCHSQIHGSDLPSQMGRDSLTR